MENKTQHLKVHRLAGSLLDIVHLFKFFTSSAADDLHTQVEGVSELHRENAKVPSFDKPVEPAGHRGSANHSHLKHLQLSQDDANKMILLFQNIQLKCIYTCI